MNITEEQWAWVDSMVPKDSKRSQAFLYAIADSRPFRVRVETFSVESRERIGEEETANPLDFPSEEPGVPYLRVGVWVNERRVGLDARGPLGAGLRQCAHRVAGMRSMWGALYNHRVKVVENAFVLTVHGSLAMELTRTVVPTEEVAARLRSRSLIFARAQDAHVCEVCRVNRSGHP